MASPCAWRHHLTLTASPSSCSSAQRSPPNHFVVAATMSANSFTAAMQPLTKDDKGCESVRCRMALPRSPPLPPVATPTPHHLSTPHSVAARCEDRGSRSSLLDYTGPLRLLEHYCSWRSGAQRSSAHHRGPAPRLSKVDEEQMRRSASGLDGHSDGAFEHGRLVLREHGSSWLTWLACVMDSFDSICVRGL